MKRPFFKFDSQADAIWRTLYARQMPQCQQHAARIWLDGVEKIGLSPDRVPDFAEMNERFKALVGWELVSTDVQFSDGQDWFEHLARRQFLITEYIRDIDALEYTPLPDIWHDAFGHLPLMANQRYADYVQRFAEYALQFSREERKSLGSLWWYTIEFGFMMEDEVMKCFGAGLMSSYGEMIHALSDAVEKVPYSLDAFEKIDPSPRAMHHRLFILSDFDQLEQSVVDWVASHRMTQ
ncbi:MAG: aromatic amino acid hydroxylase [Anaerolineae bacterium]